MKLGTPAQERYAGLYYSDEWHDVPYDWGAYALCSGNAPSPVPTVSAPPTA